MRRLIARLFLTFSLFAGAQFFVHAQTAAYAEIAQIDTANFPQVSALVDVYDANGDFISGLKPADFTVYEDAQEGTVDSVVEKSPPVQVVVAVNPGPALGVRDSNAVTRFEHVTNALGRWTATQTSESQDDMSLVSLSGSLITHAHVKDWSVSLTSF